MFVVLQVKSAAVLLVGASVFVCVSVCVCACMCECMCACLCVCVCVVVQLMSAVVWLDNASVCVSVRVHT